MSEQMVTLDEVGAAVERLVGHVLASGCDGEYARTIHMAGVDLLAILRGEWDLTCPLCGEGLKGMRCEVCEVNYDSAADVEKVRYAVEVGYYRQIEGAAGEDADVVRCPSCNQSLWEIQSVTKFACPGCYETFGDEAVDGILGRME